MGAYLVSRNPEIMSGALCFTGTCVAEVKLVVDPLALAELHDTAAFYALKANIEPGFAFVAESGRTANFVLANPLLGAVFRGTRRSSGHRGAPS